MNRESLYMNVKKIAQCLFDRHSNLQKIKETFEFAFDKLVNAVIAGGKILVCGNGGSAADAEHIVGELMKGFLLKRELRQEDIQDMQVSIHDKDIIACLQRAIPAISLSSQLALLTAVSNDVSADMIYAQQVYGYAKPNDILIGLSTSGNSKNVVNAVRVANMIGIDSICITGAGPNELSKLSTLCICLPFVETYRVQEFTIPVYHTLCAMLEAFFFDKEGNK